LALQGGFGVATASRSDTPVEIATNSASIESAREFLHLRMVEPRLDETAARKAHPKHDANDR